MAWNMDDYEDVQARIKRFTEAYPMGRIVVKVLDFDKEKKSVLVEASVYRTDSPEEPPAGVDIALEWAGKSKINEKWFTENAATSAIGRAIGNVLPSAMKPTRENMEHVKAIEADLVDPWTIATNEQHVGNAVDTLRDQLGAEIMSEAPLCAHGHMLRKEGEKKDGTPYVGYLCPEKAKANQCKPRWGILNHEGKWSF